MIKKCTTKNLSVFMAGELIPERQNCKAFGCSKKLSLTEELFGKYCIGCSGTKKMDVMQVLKIK